MRIGIDARFWGSGGGIARYVERLVEELERIDTRNEYVIFLRKDAWNSYAPHNPHITKYLADVKWYGIAEQMLMPFHIARAHVDLMHFPHWNIPWLYQGAYVVTIHDLILLHYPSLRSTTHSRAAYAIKYLVYQHTVRRAILRARHIITPSEFTKQDIIRTFHTAPERVTVTYEGADAPVSLAPDAQKQIMERYGVREPYVLYVGVAYPHKNLEWLIHAMHAYNAAHNAEYQLALAGAHNYFYERILRGNAEAIAQGSLRVTGYVPDGELPALFARASAYTFPSLYEGFGLPPLQAMAYNVPVASSNKGSLPEILSDAALYFDPTDTNEFCTQMHALLTDDAVRNRLVSKGAARYQQFSWARMAQETLRVYQK